jgi:hypothetical protein
MTSCAELNPRTLLAQRAAVVAPKQVKTRALDLGPYALAILLVLTEEDGE